MIQSTFRNYNCGVIKKIVSLQLNYIYDRKRNKKTEAIAEDCNFSGVCGVVDNSGGYDWTKCPVFGKKELSF